MIGLPGVENGVDGLLVVEIAVAAIDRKLGRRDRHQHRSGAAPSHLVVLAWSDDDHFVTEPRSSTELGFYIGANASADRRVEGADVGDTHRVLQTFCASEVQVKLC